MSFVDDDCKKPVPESLAPEQLLEVVVPQETLGRRIAQVRRAILEVSEMRELIIIFINSDSGDLR